jgi:hypothetical protein
VVHQPPVDQLAQDQPIVVEETGELSAFSVAKPRRK